MRDYFPLVNQIKLLAQQIGFTKTEVALAIVTMLFLATSAALLESLSFVALLAFFSPEPVESISNSFRFLQNSSLVTFDTQQGALAAFVLFSCFALVLKGSFVALDGIFLAVTRRKTQESCYRSLIFARLSHVSFLRGGDAISACTTEATLAARVLCSTLTLFSAILTFIAYLSFAVALDIEMTALAILIVSPLIIIIKIVLRLQSILSRRAAELRVCFAGDISERIGALVHIMAAQTNEFSYKRAVNAQHELYANEVRQSTYQTVLSTTSISIPLTAVLILSLFEQFNLVNFSPSLITIAAIGLIFSRLSGALSYIMGCYSNIVRLSGSLEPVLNLLSLPPEGRSRDYGCRVSCITLDKVSFSYGDKPVIVDLSTSVRVGKPLVISGGSGSGKTSVGQLICGLLLPNSGEVIFSTSCGDRKSTEFIPRTGYVTQDVFLFSGSIRDNLTDGGKYSDTELVDSLRAVNLYGGLIGRGGLDAILTEKGANLSGGQRRRLGIARALLGNPSLLVLDEITVGLDEGNKKNIQKILERLVNLYTVIIISHDLVVLESATYLSVSRD